MYRFLGMLLKIFIMERDRGGYTAYFSKGNKRLFTGDHRSGSWIYMTLGRFKQLRAAFHPERKFAGNGGDKCYQASPRVGSSFVYLPVPRPLKTYHQYMNAVDKGDQGRLQIGGFARKAHFQKWYKKSFYALIDFMLMNGNLLHGICPASWVTFVDSHSGDTNSTCGLHSSS